MELDRGVVSGLALGAVDDESISALLEGFRQADLQGGVDGTSLDFRGNEAAERESVEWALHDLGCDDVNGRLFDACATEFKAWDASPVITIECIVEGLC